MDSTIINAFVEDILKTMDPDVKAFCLDKLTSAYFRELLSHLNIAANMDMSTDKMKEIIFLSSTYLEKFGSYKLSDVFVFFNDSLQVVNVVTADNKAALYELNCEYPCCMCNFNVDDDGEMGQGLECSVCESWFHNKCTSAPLSDDFYELLTDSPDFIKICCPPCLKNGQVKKLRTKLTKMQSHLDKELNGIKELILTAKNSSCIGSPDFEAPKNIDALTNRLTEELKLVVKHELASLNDNFQSDLESISVGISSQKELISSIKTDVCSLNNEVIISANDFVDCFQENINNVVKDTESALDKLRDNAEEAAESVKSLSQSTHCNTGAFEAALNRVVDSANRLDDIDLKSLSDNVVKSTELMEQGVNDNVFSPSAIDDLTTRLVSELPIKLMPRIIENLPHFPEQSAMASTSKGNDSTSKWIVSGAPKISPGSITQSVGRLKNNNVNSAGTSRSSGDQSNEMDARKTLTIGNVCDSSISTSSKIKSEFNKCYPMMEIVHCKRAINGFILIEVDTVENARKVVHGWDGKKYFNKGQSRDTYVQILENARAKAIIEHVDESLSDDFITHEILKVFGPKTTARRFMKKNVPTHVVLLTFDDKSDLEKSVNIRIPIGNTIFRARPYEIKPRLIQCYQCNKFNHIARNCAATTRTCAYCSEGHHENDCEIRKGKMESHYKCSNCGENHTALSKDCAIYKKWSTKLRHHDE